MTDDVTKARAGAPAGPRGPMAHLAIVASVCAAMLLLGGVLFAFASANANALGDSDRFRLLAQAANPFLALLALGASALVIHGRRSAEEHEQRASTAALGIATAVSLAMVLLVLNGLLTDVLADAGALFKLSAVINRLGALLLGAMALWLSITAIPPKGGGGRSA